MKENKSEKKYILGVDGGGTKTLCALYDLDGKKHIVQQYGPTNHEDFQNGFQELKQTLYKILDDVLKRGNLSVDQIVYSVFGMAGVDTKSQHRIISEMIREYGILQFSLLNDSYLGIMAGSKSSMGICAINGTGFCVTGLDLKGNAFQGGGIGQLTGDRGGGGYLFEQCIAHVYDALFKRGRATLMKEMLFTLLDIHEKTEFLEVIMNRMNQHQQELILNVNKLLYQAANEGDPVAVDILTDVGECYVKTIIGVTEQLHFETGKKIPLILAGSQFTKAESQISIDTIKAGLKEYSYTNNKPEFNISVLKYPCVIGAVSYALKQAGCKENLHGLVMREYDIE